MTGGVPRPPRFARRLLEWMLPPADRGSATGDLDEEYARFVRPERGRLRADLWYWRQVLLSAPGLLRSRAMYAPSGGLLVSVLGDMRFAFRVFRRRPGFTIGTVATLAMALGASTTVFTVVHPVLVQPLPFSGSDRLVRPLPGELFFLESDEAAVLGDRMTTFESFAAWGRTLFLFTGGSEAEEVRGARVAWNHFEMLGAAPMLGRTFDRDDAAADDALLLSHGLWLRRFGADPDVVGSTVDLYGREMTVIGVMGPDHVPMEFDWEAWRTIPLDPALIANSGLAGNARLRDGVSLEEARDELRRVLPAIWAEDGYVSSEEERAGLELAPLDVWLLGDVRTVLWVLAAAVGFVLLLACANVSNLLIAQGSARAKEFAVRRAIGGSGSRIGRQLAVEVGTLCALGGLAGVLVSWSSLGWFSALLPEDLPRAGAVALSPAVVAFAAGATVFAALVTGVIPALRGGAQGLGRLAGSAAGASAGRERLRIRSALVAAEMALAVVLVVGAGLMVRTLGSLQAVDPGFESAGVVTVRPSPPSGLYPAGPELDAYYERVTEELAGLPGVSSVGAIQFLPMTPGGWWTSYLPEGRSLGADENPPSTAMRVVRGDYFETMRIALIDGRLLTAADGQPDAPPVAVVNESFAREAFPGQEAVGRRVQLGEVTAEIIGVVGDVRQSDLRTGSHAEMYISFGVRPWQRMHLVVRTDAEASATVAGVAAAVRRVDSDVSLLGPRPMSEVVGQTFGRARLMTVLLGLFGLAGLAIGAVGVYGVTAQAVSERRREIGIRIALGEDAASVAGRTVVRGMVPVVLGLIVGISLSLSGASALESVLFGVQARDPGTFTVAPIVLMLVALLSLAIPAGRASRVDPVRTLREE